jgi:hypothetical protein
VVHATDVSMYSLLTLLSGGCFCVPSEDIRFDRLEKFILDADVNSAYITPLVAETLNAAVVNQSLNKLRIDGEALAQSNIWQKTT